jgi:hypothetical protein
VDSPNRNLSGVCVRRASIIFYAFFRTFSEGISAADFAMSAVRRHLAKT